VTAAPNPTWAAAVAAEGVRHRAAAVPAADQQAPARPGLSAVPAARGRREHRRVLVCAAGRTGRCRRVLRGRIRQGSCAPAAVADGSGSGQATSPGAACSRHRPDGGTWTLGTSSFAAGRQYARACHDCPAVTCPATSFTLPVLSGAATACELRLPTSGPFRARAQADPAATRVSASHQAPGSPSPRRRQLPRQRCAESAR